MSTAELLKNALVALMDTLDYEAIAEYYKSKDWKWRGNPETPTVEELKETVLYLIDGVVKDKGTSHATGGFYVRATPHELRIEVREINTKTWVSQIKFGVHSHGAYCGRNLQTTNPVLLYFNAVANHLTDFPEEYNNCP